MKGRAIVAIVGRPNVGKSSLFNRLVGRPVAIVHDEPGVTRDRHYADVWSRGREYVLVDTGGFDPITDDPMGERIAEQVEVAVQQADLVVCVLDATEGVTEADRRAVEMLRRSTKPVLFAANKADNPDSENAAMDLYRLGVGEILPISSLHGRNIGRLENAIAAALPAEAPTDAPEETEARPMRLAIIGRPNAGKSSLANRILGDDRLLVDARPGTTRDAIDVEAEAFGKKVVVVDTAGIRKKGKVGKTSSQLEAASVYQAIRAIERCDVALVVCDAEAGAADQDAKILGLAVDRGRGVVVALNKIDLLDDRARKTLEQRARDVLSFVPWAPFATVSAKTGRGVRTVVETASGIHRRMHSRVSTGELNRFFESVLATHPPPTMGSRAPRLYYVTQAEISPPLFVVMTNEPEHIHFSYQRFLVNQIRKAFGFEGVPIRVVYKSRRRRER
jgi:GTP-binding protein